MEIQKNFYINFAKRNFANEELVGYPYSFIGANFGHEELRNCMIACEQLVASGCTLSLPHYFILYNSDAGRHISEYFIPKYADVPANYSLCPGQIIHIAWAIELLLDSGFIITDPEIKFFARQNSASETFKIRDIIFSIPHQPMVPVILPRSTNILQVAGARIGKYIPIDSKYTMSLKLRKRAYKYMFTYLSANFSLPDLTLESFMKVIPSIGVASSLPDVAIKEQDFAEKWDFDSRRVPIVDLVVRNKQFDRYIAENSSKKEMNIIIDIIKRQKLFRNGILRIL